MSWLDEAKAIAERKQKENAPTGTVHPLSEENREALKRKLRLTYGEATEREIEKALNDAEDRLGKEADEKAVFAFLRTRLEE